MEFRWITKQIGGDWFRLCVFHCNFFRISWCFLLSVSRIMVLISSSFDRHFAVVFSPVKLIYDLD